MAEDKVQSLWTAAWGEVATKAGVYGEWECCVKSV